jgi:hypothetical protein
LQARRGVRVGTREGRTNAGEVSLDQIIAKGQLNRAYAQRVIRLAFRSPALTADILNGEQPAGMTLSRLLRKAMPLDWRDQRLCLCQ